MRKIIHKSSFLLIFTSILIFGSCSKKLTYSNINKPAIKYFEKTFKKNLDSIRTIDYNTEEVIEQFQNDELNLFERKLDMKKNVLDSIGYNHKKLLIIEKSASGLSGVYEEIFFCYDSNCIKAYSPPNEFTNLNITITSVELDKLRKSDRDIYALFEVFENEESLLIDDREPFRDNFGVYYITKFSNNIISYYRTASYEIGKFKEIEKIK